MYLLRKESLLTTTQVNNKNNYFIPWDNFVILNKKNFPYNELISSLLLKIFFDIIYTNDNSIDLIE